MAKVRSPNYPNMSLGPALEAIRSAFQNENRNKMARSVLAKHLGYSSLNGRALGKIGAVRAYGLVEGSGDELRVTDDAVKALMAPEGSSERAEALARLANRPPLFQELRKDFPDSVPSLDNLKYALIKRQFTPDAAEKAAKSYLATMNLAAGIVDAYDAPDPDDEDESDAGAVDFDPPPPPPGRKAKIMDGERELTTGLLSKDASFRLIVSGQIGVKEIELLIRKLELDKEILADQSDMVVVHHFRVWDPMKGEYVTQPLKSPADRIARIGGEIIAGTGQAVERSALDAHGRYNPKGTGN